MRLLLPRHNEFRIISKLLNSKIIDWIELKFWKRIVHYRIKKKTTNFLIVFHWTSNKFVLRDGESLQKT